MRKDKWGTETDPADKARTIQIRELHDVDLLDVSAVTFPAYPQTSVSAIDTRSLFPDGVPEELLLHVPVWRNVGNHDGPVTKEEREILLATCDAMKRC